MKRLNAKKEKMHYAHHKRAQELGNIIFLGNGKQGNIFIAKLQWKMGFIIIRLKIIKGISKEGWMGINQMRIALHL